MSEISLLLCFTPELSLLLLLLMMFFALILWEEELRSLNYEVALDDIKTALFSMKGLKSTGPDGIPPIFFQRQWHTVKDRLLSFVREAFNTGRINSNLLKVVEKYGKTL